MRSDRRIPFLLIVLPFALLFLYIWLPAARIGFASDDFTHLVEDATRPWYQSSDHLNRPLRNALFKILPSLFGLSPLPYRLLAFLFYALCAVLLFRFLRELMFQPPSALAVSLLFVFFPRNYEDLFFFAAFQDLVVACSILLACTFWLHYLRTKRLGALTVSLVAYLLALGFKETSIGLPVVLYCLEFVGPSSTPSRNPSRILSRYWPFLTVAVVYAAYVLFAGSASTSFNEEKGIYIHTSLLGLIPPLVRTLVNIILQFSPALSLRDLTPSESLLAAGGFLLIFFAAWVSRNLKVVAFSICWFTVFALPTAAFARSVNADRYLTLPYIGILFMVAASLDRLHPMQLRTAFAVLLAVFVYGVAATSYWIKYREYFRASANEVDAVSSQAVLLANPASLPVNAELVLVNLTHSRQVGVFNNGVRGALIDKGLPRETRVIYRFESDRKDHDEQALLHAFESCIPDHAGARSTVVLLSSHGQLKDVSGACATAIFEADRQRHPDVWIENLHNASNQPQAPRSSASPLCSLRQLRLLGRRPEPGLCARQSSGGLIFRSRAA